MRYKKVIEGTDGWSDWIQPSMKSYRMACCDCDLIHEMVFRVIPCGRGHKVIFKARRHNRATAAKRRVKR